MVLDAERSTIFASALVLASPTCGDLDSVSAANFVFLCPCLLFVRFVVVPLLSVVFVLLRVVSCTGLRLVVFASWQRRLMLVGCLVL